MVALGPLVSDNVCGPHHKALFEPGMAYPLNEETLRRIREYQKMWDWRHAPAMPSKMPIRDELFINGKLD